VDIFVMLLLCLNRLVVVMLAVSALLAPHLPTMNVWRARLVIIVLLALSLHLHVRWERLILAKVLLPSKTVNHVLPVLRVHAQVCLC
jgi:hypothetical protein